MAKKVEQDKVNKNQDKKSIIRFVVIYIVFIGAFFLITTLQPIKNIIDLNGIYTKGIVVISSFISNFIGIPAKYSGSIIMLPSISLNVQFGCNGLEAVMIYSIAILAYPASWKNKVLGIIMGFFILQIFNIIRIVFLIYSSMHFKKLFEFIHIYIAQGIMIALSLGVFFLYLNYVTGKTEIKKS
ncbi:MAG: archaeosortase/exosortase family protein [Nitrospirae bacterium]|jgi:exosortase/archaeosortase family protein|nr:archaeosortase/exosortase family protein [Nitrospirota bacterium]